MYFWFILISFFSFFHFVSLYKILKPKMNKSLAQRENEWCVIPCSSCNSKTPHVQNHIQFVVLFFIILSSSAFFLCMLVAFGCGCGCRILRQFFGRGSLILNLFYVRLGLIDCNTQTILCSLINITSSFLFDLLSLHWSLPWSIDHFLYHPISWTIVFRHWNQNIFGK